jgi:hypothetical protein
MKFATVALISLCAGYLCAQTSQTTETRTTTSSSTVNLDGTLVDQSCYTTHTQNRETKSDQNSTTTTQTEKVTTECPVTTTTTTFGLLTPEGKVVHFDDASNARVVELMKSNHAWQEDVNGRKPVKVRVVAMPNGDMMVIKEIK